MDVNNEPSASSDWLSMVRVAVTSRELPLPTKYIEQPPNVDLLLDLNVATSPTPVYTALTSAVRVPAGLQPVESHVKACTVTAVGASDAAARSLVSIENELGSNGEQPVS